MNFIFCVDDNNGLMFNRRRQSQDKILREKIFEYIGEDKLWMSEYSSKQFKEAGAFITDDEYLTKANENDYCLIEDGEYDILKCNKLIIFKWNRVYPADKYFDVDFKSMGFKKTKEEDFVGFSHKKITMEIYEKNL